MNVLIAALYGASIFLLGAGLGILLSLKLIVTAINRADISPEDRRFVKGVLGIKA